MNEYQRDPLGVRHKYLRFGTRHRREHFDSRHIIGNRRSLGDEDGRTPRPGTVTETVVYREGQEKEESTSKG